MTKRFYLTFLIVALVVAAVVSGYASSHPDGLEFVADKLGFGHTAKDQTGPMTDYEIGGRSGTGGVAGVIGALVTLALAGGLAWMLRQRSADRTK